MIFLNKLNGKQIVLNCELIESIEETPDTIITLTSGKKLIVSNSKEEIVEKIIDYKQKIYQKKEQFQG